MRQTATGFKTLSPRPRNRLETVRWSSSPDADTDSFLNPDAYSI